MEREGLHTYVYYADRSLGAALLRIEIREHVTERGDDATHEQARQDVDEGEGELLVRSHVPLIGVASSGARDHLRGCRRCVAMWLAE